jgi:hypothetical protein
MVGGFIGCPVVEWGKCAAAGAGILLALEVPVNSRFGENIPGVAAKIQI